MTIKRAILIAAGRGKRLEKHTDDTPKCMVVVGGRPIFAWVWDALTRAGVDELVVIRGYRGDILEPFVHSVVPDAIFVDNNEWPTNNVLLSLACARNLLDRPTYVLYSDIVFTPQVAAAAARSTAEIGLVIDRDFRSTYHGRTEHPLEEGEVADLHPNGSVARVGKRALPPDEAVGEFIGLMRLGARGADIVAAELDRLLHRFANNDRAAFQRAAQFRNAYLTDLLQELIGSGVRVDPILVDGQWREIDTTQDLERADALLRSSPDVWAPPGSRSPDDRSD
jgi:choline kinase